MISANARTGIFLICLLISHAFPLITFSQHSPAKVFSPEEDNLTPAINTIFKNRDGYLFAGTTNGLYKFDGARFSRISFVNADYTDTVTAVFEDRDRMLWVGFQGGRIAHLKNGILSYWNPEEGTPSNRITAFTQGKDGTIWFSANGEGVYYFNNGRIFLVNNDNGLNDLNVSTITLASNGDILAATDDGLYALSLNHGKVSITNTGPSEGLPDYIVTSVAPAGNNGFWIGMQDKGFCYLSYPGKKIINPFSPGNWTFGQVNSIIEHQGIVWIGTHANGLIKFNLSDSSIENFPLPASRNSVNALMNDSQGNLWVSVPGTGLIRTPGETITMFPMPEGTVYDHIHALLRDMEGNFWTTDQYNNVVRITYKNTMPVVRKVPIGELNEKTDITSLYQDIFGNIWIGTMGRGIFILDPVTLSYRQFNEHHGFLDASILSITGRENRIYVSSLQGCIMLTSSKKGINSLIPWKSLDMAGIGSDYVYTILEDSKGRLWFATDGNGLSVLDGSLTTYDKTSGLKDERIYAITEGKDGSIWFSTANAGIYSFYNGKFTNYGLREGLTDLNISSLKTDATGNIVIVNKKGLDILDPKTGKVYYNSDNIGISMLNVEDIGTTAQDHLGNVYVISETSIIRYSPKSSQFPPKTILENVQLFLKDIGDSSDNIFRHDENSFTFNYIGLYYSDPEHVYYQYRLDGLDTSWILTRDRSKTFPNLAPGKYTFRIRSSLNRNFRNADEATYSFTINQAFYKQAWFIILMLFVIGGLLFGYIKARERRLRKLERLRQDQQRIKFEVLRNQVNPHFLFNSFNTLISTIEEDPKTAVEYAEQLSDFFRNIVTYRDKDIITLQDELNLLETYYYLQKKRYGSNLILEEPTGFPDNFFIPPLTLQLLMENAIKHNSVSRENPLRVTLTVMDGYLEVKNNINPRLSKEKSSGMGLQNIVNRYGLLTSKNVIIENKDGYFKVSLPQITNPG